MSSSPHPYGCECPECRLATFGASPAAGPNRDELDLCYMSIETLKAQVARLEAENADLRARIDKMHGEATLDDDWRSAQYDGYNGGFRGHGY